MGPSSPACLDTRPHPHRHRTAEYRILDVAEDVGVELVELVAAAAADVVAAAVDADAVERQMNLIQKLLSWYRLGWWYRVAYMPLGWL